MTPDSEETTAPANGAQPADSSTSISSMPANGSDGAADAAARPSLLQTRESARAGVTTTPGAPPSPEQPPLATRPAAEPAPQPRPADAEVAPQSAAPPLTYASPPDASMLRNPYVLAGTAVAGAIVLAVMVVIFFGSGGGASGETDRRSNTPVSGGAINPLTPQARSGVEVRSIAAATVRTGPELDYPEIGPLRSGQDVTVVGRNPNSTWFQIQFPPGTSFTGWVPATALRVPEASLASIPLSESTPIPRPTIIIPTSIPVPAVTRPPALPPTITPTPGPPTPAPPPAGSDLSAQAVAGTCAVGNRLRVSVTNTGPSPVQGKPLAILTQNAQGVQKSIVSQIVTLAVGQTVTLDTGYIVEERVVAVVDPLGTIGDTNAGNNRVDCVVGPAPTSTPRAATPAPAVPPTIPAVEPTTNVAPPPSIPTPSGTLVVP